ncbi:hypothetical protein E2C01_102537 [Portunus trituberculatus]|uniref:Uncharacterized protein n=1 Tax=Portunus trituberculatus TaxID=210409 RepID=A0A5B7K8H9_PORTR|nr:hypothetical protein [Portunus trituberculatus]
MLSGHVHNPAAPQTCHARRPDARKDITASLRRSPARLHNYGP